jgi:indolepyruvate ferredoxin oxidoreductase beta subunit
MKKDIVLTGVGGQGIVSIAAIIGYAALEQGWFLKQSEVHGMSQRGGDVMSNLRISEHEIASDVIPFGQADLIISIEPLESIRHLPFLSPDGWIITNTNPFKNVPNYPDLEKILSEIQKIKNHIALDADSMAKEIGSARVSNIVVLGAASPFLGIGFDQFEQSIQTIFMNKGDGVIEMNLKALQAGRSFTDKKIH